MILALAARNTSDLMELIFKVLGVETQGLNFNDANERSITVLILQVLIHCSEPRRIPG